MVGAKDDQRAVIAPSAPSTKASNKSSEIEGQLFGVATTVSSTLRSTSTLKA